MAEDDVITNAEAVRLYEENLRRSRDQPVTPDREALTAKVMDAFILEYGVDCQTEAEIAVDAVLPLLTDALDRARQQGRDEMTREVVDWLSVGGVDLVAKRIPADPWDACADVDPFTGQPDQHEHGDACVSEACISDDNGTI